MVIEAMKEADRGIADYKRIKMITQIVFCKQKTEMQFIKPATLQ